MLELIREIRNQTGAGVIDIKKALEEAKEDKDEAIEILRKKGLEKADKREGHEAKEGIIATYVHSNGRVASLVKLLCETDFVARNEEFQELANDLAMQVAAMNPTCLSPGDVPDDIIEQNKKDWKEEIEKDGKPEEIMKKIIEGKEKKLRGEQALLTQAFIKDQDRTVEDIIKGKIAKMGENIKVEEFTRVEL